MSDLTNARNEINLIDKEMAELFERRMKAVETVAAHKKTVGMPIHDEKREREVVARNCDYISDPVIREYYVNFINETMKLSSSYQSRLNESRSTALRISSICVPNSVILATASSGGTSQVKLATPFLTECERS